MVLILCLLQGFIGSVELYLERKGLATREGMQADGGGFETRLQTSI
jgi:hypothetical protein